MKKATKTSAESLFKYWKSGDTDVAVNPDPPLPDEAKPFHVVIREEGWIPVSILVFARSPEHALSRVHQALVTCRDKEYVRERDDHEIGARREKHVNKFLAAMDGTSKEMYVEISALDVGLICAEVNWASNGDLL